VVLNISEFHLPKKKALHITVGSGQLEDLSSQVLHDSRQVHGGAGTDAGGVLALLQIAVHTTNGELESLCLRGARDALASLGLSTACSSLACLSGHDVGLNMIVGTSEVLCRRNCKIVCTQFELCAHNLRNDEGANGAPPLPCPSLQHAPSPRHHATPPLQHPRLPAG
jgi:hypothetical protein